MSIYLQFAFSRHWGAAGSALAKRAAKVFTETDVKWTSLEEAAHAVFSNWYILLSVLSFGCAFAAYIAVLGRVNLHIAYPVFVSASVILVTISSIIFFGETLRILNILGIALILGGIVLLTVK